MALAEQLQVETQVGAGLGGSYISFGEHLKQAASYVEPVRLPILQLYEPVPLSGEPGTAETAKKQGKFGRLAIAGAFLATTLIGLKELPAPTEVKVVPAVAAGQPSSDTIDMRASVHSASIEEF